MDAIGLGSDDGDDADDEDTVDPAEQLLRGLFGRQQGRSQSQEDEDSGSEPN